MEGLLAEPATISVDWTNVRMLDLYPRFRSVRANRSNHLSGSKQHRLLIRRAFMTKSRLLILNSPTKNLVRLICDAIWRMLGIVRQAGLVGAIMDKPTSTVLSLADRAAVRINGQSAWTGALELLLHRHHGLDA